MKFRAEVVVEPTKDHEQAHKKEIESLKKRLDELTITVERLQKAIIEDTWA